MIPIDMLLEEWRGSDKAVREFSFDPDMPEKKRLSKEKALRTSLMALVINALP